MERQRWKASPSVGPVFIIIIHQTSFLYSFIRNIEKSELQCQGIDDFLELEASGIDRFFGWTAEEDQNLQISMFCHWHSS